MTALLTRTGPDGDALAVLAGDDDVGRMATVAVDVAVEVTTVPDAVAFWLLWTGAAGAGLPVAAAGGAAGAAEPWAGGAAGEAAAAGVPEAAGAGAGAAAAGAPEAAGAGAAWGSEPAAGAAEGAAACSPQGTVMYLVAAAQSLTEAGQLVTVTVLVTVTGASRAKMEAEAAEARTAEAKMVLRILGVLEE